MRSAKRDGFSLLELLLALALSVVLMGMVGITFSFYATKLDTRDMDVRRVKLAHAVLDMISDDLRGAIHPPEFDPSSLEASMSLGSGGGGAQPGEGQDLSAAGLDDMSEPEDESSSLASGQSAETSDLSAGTTTTSRPGLLGNQTQIQFDVSRLPRIEEYQRMIAPAQAGQVVDVPSDIKTVCYYVQPDGGAVQDPLALQAASGTNTGNGGLVRRSLDRAITQWSLENGGMAGLMASGDLLASEVVGLQFRYWDGLQWMTYWDSDEFDCLPLAIEVTLTVSEPGYGTDNLNATAGTQRYVQLIRLPMGRPVEQDTGSLSSAGL